jgi:predicted transcriptional regulator
LYAKSLVEKNKLIVLSFIIIATAMVPNIFMRGVYMSFFIVPGEVFDYGLKPNEIVVFSYLCSCADNNSFDCFPSVKKIAKACNMGQSTVRVIIHTLKEKGIIKIKSQYKQVPDTDKRRQTSNLYHISLLEECRKEEREYKKYYKLLSSMVQHPEGESPENRDQITKPNITTIPIENKSSGFHKSCSDVSVSLVETEYASLTGMCIQELSCRNAKLASCSDVVLEALNIIWNERVFDTGDYNVQRELILKRLNVDTIVSVLKQFEVCGIYDVNPLSLCETLHSVLVR